MSIQDVNFDLGIQVQVSLLIINGSLVCPYFSRTLWHILQDHPLGLNNRYEIRSSVHLRTERQKLFFKSNAQNYYGSHQMSQVVSQKLAESI